MRSDLEKNDPRIHFTEALEAARRASVRSAAIVHLRMKRGLAALATIASIAPWLGLFGTVLGIWNSFGAVNGEKSAIMAALAQSLSDSLMPAALGLVVALLAMCFYKYLSTKAETFALEMEAASLQLINDLYVFGSPERRASN